MKVTSSVNGNTQTFGHSFRVSICLKNETGCGDFFVSPASNKKLYRQLNSKIVGWLNEDYIESLRNVLGVARKTKKTEPLSDIHRKMINELREIDTDYAVFGNVRSVYNGGRLGSIATGVDVPIIENLKGAKQIGLAKSDSQWYNGVSVNEYVRSLSRIVQQNINNYVQDPSILLRSKNNKEIMLRAVFKEVRTPKGQTAYELDGYEFHENRTKPTLPPIKPEILRYKYNTSMQEEIKKTIKYLADKITGRKTHFYEIEKFSSQKKNP